MARHSMLELILTTILLFCITTLVRFVFGPSWVSRAVTGIHWKLLIVAVAVAPLLAGLIISRPGKLSGGHMNPAISSAMWRFGVFPGAGVVPYITAQLLGSVLGVLAARAIWGVTIERPPTLYAVIQPAPAWSTVPLFVTEAFGMGVIVFIIGYCLSVHRLTPLVPWVVGGLIALAVVVLGTSTGASLNPARQFGPAVISEHTDKLWVYLLAPMVGAEIAVRLLQAFQKPRHVLTHRLCGTEADGSPLRSGEAARIVKPAAQVGKKRIARSSVQRSRNLSVAE